MQIILIGFMGSGKTKLGKRLAKALGMQFIDLDRWIEAKERKAIRVIFEELGEDGFREIERVALQEVLASYSENHVIACGGGTPCFFDNIDRILASGLLVYLDVPIPELKKRLWLKREKRPLLDGLKEEEMEDFLAQKIEARAPFYEQAHLMIKAPSLAKVIASIDAYQDKKASA